MVTKHGFLITMVISAAVGALILAYSAPTQGAGAGGKGSSSGASKSTNISEPSNADIGESSKLDTGETRKTKTDQIRNVHHPDMAGEVPPKPTVSGGKNSVKIQLDEKSKINANAAIFGNQGVAGKGGTGGIIMPKPPAGVPSTGVPVSGNPVVLSPGVVGGSPVRHKPIDPIERQIQQQAEESAASSIFGGHPPRDPGLTPAEAAGIAKGEGVKLGTPAPARPVAHDEEQASSNDKDQPDSSIPSGPATPGVGPTVIINGVEYPAAGTGGMPYGGYGPNQMVGQPANPIESTPGPGGTPSHNQAGQTPNPIKHHPKPTSGVQSGPNDTPK